MCSFAFVDFGGDILENMSSRFNGSVRVGDQVFPMLPTAGMMGNLKSFEGVRFRIPLSSDGSVCGFAYVELAAVQVGSEEEGYSIVLNFLKNLVRGDSDPLQTDYGARNVRMVQ